MNGWMQNTGVQIYKISFAMLATFKLVLSVLVRQYVTQAVCINFLY
jgi:hypothetical protein